MDSTLVDGAYSVWLRELMRALPAAQLRLVWAEDLLRAPVASAAESLAFLGLPAHPAVEKAALAVASMERRRARQPRAEAPAHSATGFYQAFDAELEHLMDNGECISASLEP